MLFRSVSQSRYNDFSDAAAGFKDLVYDTFKYGINAGNKHYKSPQMAAMDYLYNVVTMLDVYTTLSGLIIKGEIECFSLS